MDNKEINISYESLFELLRREKAREDLQKLDEGFFHSVVDYISESEVKLDLFKQKTDLQSIDEKSRVEKQMQNVKKIINELYDRREKKIIDMAINKARTSTNIVDTSCLLSEETVLFDKLVGSVNSGRQSILYKILSKELPTFEPNKNEAFLQNQDASQNKEEEKKESENLMVRIISAVPKFVSPELEVYGPFEPEDMASLPRNIAEILIKKSRAELMGE